MYENEYLDPKRADQREYSSVLHPSPPLFFALADFYEAWRAHAPPPPKIYKDYGTPRYIHEHNDKCG